jgi:diaminohydroxyphosphoribosylaminopyrimidine deaminase/5-amino-6-(5-phosphoribosylamino)uracil reductase
MTRGIADTLDEARLRTLLAELARDAAAFRFEVAPNPAVGAAVIAGEAILGRGFHRVWGEAHAEVAAIDAAIQSGAPTSRFEALVVTLEPCSSHGKTPPCVERILQSGIRCVVVGALDPDPRHRGRGLELLRAAGVEVVLLEGESALHKVAPHFLSWTDNERVRRPRPWTIAKWAQTRSGQLTPPTGVGGGRWISGPEALQEVQILRGRVDAIVTGVGTVLADDPRFTVRPPGNLSKPPMRVVLDSNLRTPPNAAILRTPGANEAGGPVHILCVGGARSERHSALLDAGAHVHELHVATDDGVSLRDVQAWLWEQGVRRMLLECGPRLLSHYLTSGFVDQVRIYTGQVNGGRGASMAEWMTRLKFQERLDREHGGDAVLEGFLRERT